MSKLLFSTKPQKRYYIYVADGHIYEICSKRPTSLGYSCGYWYCYFECNPYHKCVNGETYPLYENVNGDYLPVNGLSFNSGNEYYFFPIDGATPVKHEGNYYSRNGKESYVMPNPANELPLINYTKSLNGKYSHQVYYLDTLIKAGAKYDYIAKKFEPIDDKCGEVATTYGDILLDMVKNSISINAFDNGVNSLPEYLKGTDLTKEYNIENIGYVIPANYLVMFGGLFVEKLNEAMKNYGDTIVKKYTSCPSITPYNNIQISTSESMDTPVVGTITNTPILTPVITPIFCQTI